MQVIDILIEILKRVSRLHKIAHNYGCGDNIILEQAENTGKVQIQREDGRTFALIPEEMASSPLDVPSIHAKITSHEIVDMVREGREREMVR